MPHQTKPHHLFMQSAEINQAMRGMALQFAPFIVAYRDTAAAMLAEVSALLEGDGSDQRGISSEAAELYAAMAGVPLREKRRILECLDILRGWYDNGLVDVSRAQSVAIYVGPQVTANDLDHTPIGRAPLTLAVKN